MQTELTASLESLEQLFQEKGKEIKQNFESVASELSENGQRSFVSGLSLLLSQVQTGTKQTTKPVNVINNNKEQQQTITPEPLCSLPEVSCIYPRGVFTIEFSEEATVLRGKSNTLLVKGHDVIRSQILEQDASTGTVLVRVKESSSFPSGVVLFTLKGKNTGKAKAILSPNENRNVLREPLLSKAEDESSTRLALFGGLLYLVTKERVLLESFTRKLFIKCNIKSVNEGKLFLLDDCIVFVGSPLTVIDKSKAENCVLEKSNSRMYELHVKVAANENQTSQTAKNSKNSEIEFSQISVEDVSMLQIYLQQARFGKSASSSSGHRSEGNKDEQHQQSSSESEDSDSMSSDDSPYTSDESSDDSDSEEDSEASGGDQDSASEGHQQEPVETKEEEEQEDDSSSSSSSSEDDEEDDDPNLAEIVDEEPFEVDPSDVIASGKKRRRTINAVDQ